MAIFPGVNLFLIFINLQPVGNFIQPKGFSIRREPNKMKKLIGIDGFAVEIIPCVRPGRIFWSAWFVGQPYVRASGITYDDALKELSAKWHMTKIAYEEAGLPVPTPERRSGNRRMQDTVCRLAKGEFTPVF